MADEIQRYVPVNDEKKRKHISGYGYIAQMVPVAQKDTSNSGYVFVEDHTAALAKEQEKREEVERERDEVRGFIARLGGVNPDDGVPAGPNEGEMMTYLAFRTQERAEAAEAALAKERERAEEAIREFDERAASASALMEAARADKDTPSALIHGEEMITYKEAAAFLRRQSLSTQQKETPETVGSSAGNPPPEFRGLAGEGDDASPSASAASSDTPERCGGSGKDESQRIGDTATTLPPCPGCPDCLREEDAWICDSCGKWAPADAEGWEQTGPDDAGVTVERCPGCRLTQPDCNPCPVEEPSEPCRVADRYERAAVMEDAAARAVAKLDEAADESTEYGDDFEALAGEAREILRDAAESLGPAPVPETSPIRALHRAGKRVKGGYQNWLRGAPTHVLAELLAEVEAEGWELRPVTETEPRGHPEQWPEEVWLTSPAPGEVGFGWLSASDSKPSRYAGLPIQRYLRDKGDPR